MISCGAGESLLNALLTLGDPGNKVSCSTRPTAGWRSPMRLAGGVQVFTPLVPMDAIAASDRVAAIAAEGGYYCLLDTRGTGLRAADFAARLLAEERVAVTPMQGCGSDDFGSTGCG